MTGPARHSEARPGDGAGALLLKQSSRAGFQENFEGNIQRGAAPGKPPSTGSVAPVVGV